MDRDDPLEQRRHLLRLLLASGGAIAGSALLAPLVHAFGNVPKKLPPNQSIYDMRGRVTVDGKPASRSTPITANSKVQTASNSYVVFAVGQDAHLLRENSTLELSGADALADAMRLFTGRVLSVFGQRAAGKRMALQTTTATIGIRGTGVYMESEPDSSYVCTCYGAVALASSTNPEAREDIVSRHHDAPRYILANPEGGKLIIPAPMKNHTDEELMLIEEIVGRQAPIASAQGYSAPRRGY
ncbi:MAG: hypothetical protein Q8J78_02685 [Moraxellaceae bacterium]|nr:hypothetical protein [Moraxellaceae bacterium]